jgi:SAM-dependent methyltransferase
MMDGFGFPAGAGSFRFRGELHSVADAIKNLRSSISVLDLGSGAGIWTEYFAQRFSKVVSVEASTALYETLHDRCSRYPNVATFNEDVLSFSPKDKYGLVFLGGLLMGLVLCRESTIRHGVKALQGDYQVVYRSVETYRSILVEAGFDIVSVQANAAYINVQMACELIKKWKALMGTNPTGGDRFQCLPVVGRLAYWGLRLGHPWNTRLIPWLFARMGREFPLLTNHFFVLRPSSQAVVDRRDTSLHGRRIKQKTLENAR